MIEYRNVQHGQKFESRLAFLRWEREWMATGVDYCGRPLHPDFVSGRLAELDREIAAGVVVEEVTAP